MLLPGTKPYGNEALPGDTQALVLQHWKTPLPITIVRYCPATMYRTYYEAYYPVLSTRPMVTYVTSTRAYGTVQQPNA